MRPMIDTAKYASAVELAHRMGWTLEQTQKWARENGARHLRYGWLVERGRAEELIAGRIGR